MKSLSKSAAVLASGVALTAMSLSPVLADSPGQLQGGSITYQVKDVTQSGTYGNSISANVCDELQYRVDLHNTEFGALHNIVVTVDLPAASATSNNSTMVATTSAGGTTGTSGAATVTFSSAQSVSYENGTAQLLDGNGTFVKSLPDTLTKGGVNVGDLNGSTGEYVIFKAKVSCPSTPTPTPTPTPVTPAALPQTGAGEFAGLAGLAGSGAIGYGAMSYRRSKKALADKLRGRK